MYKQIQVLDEDRIRAVLAIKPEVRIALFAEISLLNDLVSVMLIGAYDSDTHLKLKERTTVHAIIHAGERVRSQLVFDVYDYDLGGYDPSMPSFSDMANFRLDGAILTKVLELPQFALVDIEITSASKSFDHGDPHFKSSDMRWRARKPYTKRLGITPEFETQPQEEHFVENYVNSLVPTLHLK